MSFIGEKIFDWVVKAGGWGTLFVAIVFTLFQQGIVACAASLIWQTPLIPVGVKAADLGPWAGVLLALFLVNALFVGVIGMLYQRASAEKVWQFEEEAWDCRKSLQEKSEEHEKNLLAMRTRFQEDADQRINTITEQCNAMAEQDKRALNEIHWRKLFSNLASGTIGKIEVLEPKLVLSSRTLTFTIWLYNPLEIHVEITDVTVQGLHINGALTLGRDLLAEREDQYGNEQWRPFRRSVPARHQYKVEISEKRAREIAQFDTCVLPFGFAQLSARLRATAPNGNVETEVFIYGQHQTVLEIQGDQP